MLLLWKSNVIPKILRFVKLVFFFTLFSFQILQDYKDFPWGPALDTYSFSTLPKQWAKKISKPDWKKEMLLILWRSIAQTLNLVLLRCAEVWDACTRGYLGRVGCTNLGLMRSSREVTFYLCVMLLRSVIEQHINSGWPLMQQHLNKLESMQKIAAN